LIFPCIPALRQRDLLFLISRCPIWFFYLLGDSGICYFGFFAVRFGSFACRATAGFVILGFSLSYLILLPAG